MKEFNFKLEKELQRLTEQNLNSIFNLKLVRSEFSLRNFRLDTLAFDQESKSFVIIEYKRDKNYSVIDQGYAYLSLMLNNKADFILEFNENFSVPLKRENIDWSQSKVIFVSPSFTDYQKEAINFKDLPIELWEVKRYQNNFIIYNQIKTPGSRESIKTISNKNEQVKKVSEEIKVFTEEEHLNQGSEGTKDLYEKLKLSILNLDQIEVKPKKKYVAFVSGSNVVDVVIQKSALKIFINLKVGELEDTKNIARNVSNVGHWGNGDYEIQLKNDEDLEYIISLIKQSLKKNRK